MRHNNCVTRKLSHMSKLSQNYHIFLHKRIKYGHVTRHAYACSHICLRSRQLKQLPSPEAVRLVRSVYVPLVRFSHFVRYQEKRNTTSWTVFLIPRALRKTKNGSCFVFRFSHSTRNEKNKWRHCRFSFFALPEMRNTKNGS